MFATSKEKGFIHKSCCLPKNLIEEIVYRWIEVDILWYALIPDDILLSCRRQTAGLQLIELVGKL